MAEGRDAWDNGDLERSQDNVKIAGVDVLVLAVIGRMTWPGVLTSLRSIGYTDRSITSRCNQGSQADAKMTIVMVMAKLNNQCRRRKTPGTAGRKGSMIECTKIKEVVFILV
jgi:hypothetical protein